LKDPPTRPFAAATYVNAVRIVTETEVEATNDIESITFHTQSVCQVFNVAIDNRLFHEELWISIEHVSENTASAFIRQALSGEISTGSWGKGRG
jgi:hypothetical protein